MSAFMCSNAHFDALASYAAKERITLRTYNLTGEARLEANEAFQGNDMPNLITFSDRVGAILHAANVRSVEYRYEDCRTSNAMGTKNPYQFQPVVNGLSHAEALMAVRCLEYQSCEPQEWETSLAKLICEAITDTAIRGITSEVRGCWPVEEEMVRPSSFSWLSRVSQ
jgi:hypothetical protein